jgi:hypothetical protein
MLASTLDNTLAVVLVQLLASYLSSFDVEVTDERDQSLPRPYP